MPPSTPFLRSLDTFAGTSFVRRPFQELSDGLKDAFLLGDTEERREQWKGFSKTMEIASRAFFHASTAPLKDYWFSENGADQAVCESTLTLLYQLLQGAQYELLGPDVMLDAGRNDYQIAFPVACVWSALDATLFPQWYAKHGIFPADACPSYAKRLMIFTRGVHIEHSEGLFIYEKIDLLLRVGWEKVMTKLGVELRSNRELRDEELQQLSSPTRKGAMPSGSFPSFSAVSEGTSFAVKSLEQQRVTLRDAMIKHGYFRSLWTRVKLSEPFFNRVVVVYRPSDSAETSERMHLHLREYTCIPFADLEALYPFRKIHLPPFDTVKFALQIVLLVWFLMASSGEYSASDTFGALSFFAVLAGAIVARIISLVYGYMAYVSYYENILDSWLDKKKESRDASTATKLCDDVASQEAKEIMLAYFFLWQQQAAGGDPLSFGELGTRVDQFLSVRMKLPGITFDVADALRKLEALGLVRLVNHGNIDHDCGEHVDSRYECVGSIDEWTRNHSVEHILGLNLHR
jgi:hypothetical protein